ncbi:MAG: biotin--[acetyl-CoA-carboxylase] ligase [Verrucomicrobia bacterium]|nr:biotin--[acetyl-CoA-carboxylase] ligase [Verrucomicrobiota bacterium]MBS0636195.1 biotin--[acetyl-CoA-carboxylase] ligase [Verrucomicrobiota bacterium]
MNIRYYHITKVTSTNTWAKEHAHEFAHDEIAAITADEQTHGRGRYARVWHSPAGKNLYLTLAFYSNIKPFALCQLASLTLEEFLQIHGITAKIKWPNDLLVNGKKIVGVLTERQEVNGMAFIVLGIGLNVNMNGEEIAEIPQAATSMFLEKNHTFSLDAVKQFYVRLFVKRLLEAQENNFADVWSHWQKSLNWMLEHPVCIQTHAKRLEGKVIALDKEGNLLLQGPDGHTHTIQSADVNL